MTPQLFWMVNLHYYGSKPSFYNGHNWVPGIYRYTIIRYISLYIYIHTIIDPQKIGRQSPQKIPSRVHRAAWHKAWVDRSYGKPIIDAQRGSGLLISLVLWHFAAGNYCIY